MQWTRRWLGLGLGLVMWAAFAVGPPRQAVAETDVDGGEFRDEVIRDNSLLEAGRMEAAVQFGGIFTADRATPDGQKTSNFGTLYLNPDVAFGYMVSDRVQVRGNFGYVKLQSKNDGDLLQDTNAAQLRVQGLYHIPLRYGTAFYGGIGLGSFLGTTSRPVDEEGVEGAEYNNSTKGLVGQGLVGLLVQPGPSLTLRGGVRFDGIAAWETPEDGTGQQPISAQNFKVLGDFAVGLRF